MQQQFPPAIQNLVGRQLRRHIHCPSYRRWPGVQGGRVSHLEVPPPAGEFDELDERDEGAEVQLLRRAMALVRDHFEERTWKAFLATAVEGRTPRDVAEDLDTTAGAVRVAKSRVLSRLRMELGDLPPGEGLDGPPSL